ncbi:MAG: cupin domain-containing protein [Anaerolineae bacterium]|jgi:mannose-6-phosphate isomerase-like protein (cupin superfamily)
MEKKHSISEVAARLEGPFKHFVVGQVDDYCAYLVRIEGNYLFHQHPKDEMYLVLEGELTIDYRLPCEEDKSLTLGRGETLVVRAGERHRSGSEKGALVLMFKAHDLFAE